MTRRTILAAVLSALGVLAPGIVRAAEWNPGHSVVSPPGSSATLGATSHSAVVGPDGRVHLVYQENLVGGGFEVLYTVREASGEWIPPVHLAPPGQSVRNAAIALAPDGRIHVLWEAPSNGEEDIGHVMRTPDGNWTEPQLVSPAPGFSRFPVGAVDSFGRLHAVWTDARNAVQRILHASWTEDAGWSGVRVLSTSPLTPQDPTIDADRLGGVHVLWSDRIPSDPHDPVWNLFYVRIDAATGSVPAPSVLVQGQGIAVRPFLATRDDGTIHVVWLDDRASSRYPGYEIFYKRYLPGIGWGKDKRFTYDFTNHGRPVIVDGAGQSLNVVWEDYRSGAPDIFYRQITPERGWDREATPLTTDVSSSQSPILVSLPEGRLLLIWSDSQETGSFRILAKEGLAAP